MLADPLTIDTPVPMETIAIADLDNDGDLDLAGGQRTDDSALFMILENAGGGSFLPAVQYDVQLDGFGGIGDIRLGDVTGDGVIDAVVLGAVHLVTFVGRSDGGFESPEWASIVSAPTHFLLEDITGDGRRDAIIGDNNGVRIIPNTCGGDIAVLAESTRPVINPDQTASVRVRVFGVQHAVISPAPPAPTGTVTVHLGSSALESAVLGAGATPTGAEIAVPVSGSLGVGTHTLHVEYAGDEHYFPQASPDFVQRVTSVTTTPALTVDAEPRYGDRYYYRATMTASDGSTPEGVISYFLDNAPAPTWGTAEITVGSHTLRAEYSGSNDHAPSVSATVTFELLKAFSNVQFVDVQPFVRMTPTTHFQFVANDTATGAVRLFDGSAQIGSAPLVNGLAELDVSLGAGRHTLTARLDETATHLASETTRIQTVVPDVPMGLAAYATGSEMRLQWLPVAGTQYWAVEHFVGGSWTAMQCVGSDFGTTCVDPAAQPFAPEIYRVRAWKSATELLATSNADVAMIGTFNDEPLVPGVTRVKAGHFSQLLGAANVLRSRVAYSPLSLTNAIAGAPIRATHLLTLQDGIADVRAALGMPLPSFEMITAGTSQVRADQLQRVRDMLR